MAKSGAIGYFFISAIIVVTIFLHCTAQRSNWLNMLSLSTVDKVFVNTEIDCLIGSQIYCVHSFHKILFTEVSRSQVYCVTTPFLLSKM